MIGPRKVDKPLVLYGYGNLGHLAEEIFRELNIPIVGIIDKKGFGISGPIDNLMIAVCIASEPYMPIYNSLTEKGWTDIVSVYDIIEAYPEAGIHNGWFAGELTNEDAYPMIDVRRNLDHESTVHYNAFVDWHWRHMTDTMYPLVIELKPKLPSTLADIRERQKVITFADTPMIKAVSIHNEGCELKTLEENMHIFQKYRPAIEVACYHSRDGLWRIQKTLMDSLPDYRWTFRLHAHMGQGAYLYGIPEKKL